MSFDTVVRQHTQAAPRPAPSTDAAVITSANETVMTNAEAARFPEPDRAWAVLEQLRLAEKLRLTRI
jgi:5-enolpyruvylshikimate-3-phosphate synthase